ncbi:MAG: four helix bundle protein [Rhizonema sp. PD38]|nr:four helix bundle protein [Rhizonema sp. PD38]
MIYQKAFQAAITIFEVSKRFPEEERYSLTDPAGSAVAHGGNPQDRAASPDSSFRSAQFVLTSAEAWRKRRYKGSFIALIKRM